MKTIIKLEEMAMTGGALYLLSFFSLGLPLWLWCILFFVPDIGMAGYAINTRYGARVYNLFHHKGVAIALALIGIVTTTEVLLAIGLLLFAHASFDRMLGYGLKYENDFKNTHLGSWHKQPKQVNAM